MVITVSIGSAFALGILVAIVIVKYYQNIRLIIADITSFISKGGKGVKKFSLKNEVEGSINLMAEYFNKGMPSPLLPQCKVEWVKSQDQKTFLSDGEAIVCLTFDKKDRNKNVYNALYSFVHAGLINQAKPFMKKETTGAIDLLVTKTILKKARPRILQKFNEHFLQEQNDCKQRFYTLEDIEETGFFQSLLIPELKLFGDNVFTKTPNDNIEQEAERFVDWLHALVTRERGEDSLLYFKGNNIKVGVILVADSEVYDQHGMDAYIRRAYLYASQEYPCVYLFSSGTKKSAITHDISNVLTNNEHFTKLNKKTNISRYNEAGNRYLITCINLKINHDIIKYDFWDNIEDAQKNNTAIKAEIQNIRNDGVLVSYLGTKHLIPQNRLSEIPIHNLNDHFDRHDILSLRVIDCDKDTETVEFTNENTETDPSGIIEANLCSEITFSVKRIIQSRMGYEVGLAVYNAEKDIHGFVPRQYAIMDRFTMLSEKYSIGQEVDLEVQKYDTDRNNYVCKVCNLSDPWASVPSTRIAVNKIVDAKIKEIHHSYVLCMIAEGVEGQLFVNDLSWSTVEINRSKLKDLKVDGTIRAKIIGIDSDRRKVNLSKKVLEGNPTIQFFEENKTNVVKGVIDRINPNGIEVTLCQNVCGYIYKSEVSWFYVNDLEERYRVGDHVNLCITDYNDKRQNLLCSIKAAEQNDFSSLTSKIRENDIVTGKVLRFFEDKAEIQIEKDGLTSYGFVHKSEISNILFITEDLYSQILVPDITYSFIILRVNPSFKTFTLSRKAYYQKTIASIQYGTQYEVNVIPTPAKVYVYSNDMEGFLTGNYPTASSIVKVIPSRIEGQLIEVYVN